MISCTSPFGYVGLKFRDRKGIYQNSDKKITVTVTDANKQNLIINVQDFNGITIDNETYDINPAITSGSFTTLKSEKYPKYIYVIIFNSNISISFSIKEGIEYPISKQELKNTSIK